MARPWRAGGDGKGISLPRIPWHEEQKMRESEEAEQARPVVEVHTQWASEEGRFAGGPRFYFACSCGACGPLRPTQLSANTDGTLHELWHEQNPTSS